MILCNNENNCKIIAKKSTIDNLKTTSYILIWFILSAKYNIYNKLRLNMLNLPYLQSTISLGSGSLIPIIFWKTGIRKLPTLNKKILYSLLPLSFFHAIGHISAVISVGAGAVSFTQIIKSAEPVFTCGFDWLFLGNKITLAMFLSLLPIVFGVSFASISELYFTWVSFNTAMISNAAFAARNVYSRAKMIKYRDISPENLLGILTIMSFIIAVPLTVIFESKKIPIMLAASAISPVKILKTSMETGIYFYLYNEAAMIVLDNINPVSHAILNTVKRIFILLTCVIFFNTPLTRNGLIGSGIAISGSYLYLKAKKMKR